MQSAVSGVLYGGSECAGVGGTSFCFLHHVLKCVVRVHLTKKSISWQIQEVEQIKITLPPPFLIFLRSKYRITFQCSPFISFILTCPILALFGKYNLKQTSKTQPRKNVHKSRRERKLFYCWKALNQKVMHNTDNPAGGCKGRKKAHLFL